MLREEKNAYMRDWTRRNRERVNAERRERYEADPYKQRHRGRLQQLSLRSGFDTETEKFIPVLVRDPCVYCGTTTDDVRRPGRPAPTSAAIDHIDSDGDSHWTNLTSSCLSCNSFKGSSSLLSSLLERELRRDLTPIAEQLWVLKGRTGSRRRIDF